jgi:NAD(P)-dependent dehydrogenase (short-subunit alcohol dehydrogenase family)
MQLRKKRVVITGGAGGIGNALCMGLVGAGARVFSIDARPPEVPVFGVAYIEADVTDGKSLARAFKRIGSPVDVLFNNAGVIRRGGIFDVSEEDFDFLFDVNVKGSWLTVKQAMPYFARRPMIVQMCSYRALHLYKDPAVYSLTKRMAMLLAEQMELSYPSFDVRTLFPGPTDTAMARYGFYGRALERRKAVLRSPEYLVKRIIRLLESDKKELVYNPVKRKYSYKSGRLHP